MLRHTAALEQLAADCEQPGTMHGLQMLLGSRFARRKQPNLICAHSAPVEGASSQLVGAVLLLEYCIFGVGTGVFATADSFGVRTVVAPAPLQAALCQRAGRLLLEQGARLVLVTQRVRAADWDVLQGTSPRDRFRYAVHARQVQDTLDMHNSAEATLQSLGKRTRVHLRADRRRFERLYPNAECLDATTAIAEASDLELAALNQGALDTIDQGEFNHQVRCLSRAPEGFVLGLRWQGRWISLLGGWRQGTAAWVEWQCNQRGFQNVSLGGVLRTYLFEDAVRHGTRTLHFHGGTSHSMGHSFRRTDVADLLVRRTGWVTGLSIGLARLLCRWRPALLRRGNFVLNALCSPGLTWQRLPALPATRIQRQPPTLPVETLGVSRQDKC